MHINISSHLPYFMHGPGWNLLSQFFPSRLHTRKYGYKFVLSSCTASLYSNKHNMHTYCCCVQQFACTHVLTSGQNQLPFGGNDALVQAYIYLPQSINVHVFPQQDFLIGKLAQKMDDLMYTMCYLC